MLETRARWSHQLSPDGGFEYNFMLPDGESVPEEVGAAQVLTVTVAA
jgi:hypothetical protein